MKKGTAIFFLFLILAVTVKDLLMYASFKVNQDYIAKNLCVNVFKPELMCGGVCQFKRILADSKEHPDGTSQLPDPGAQKQSLFIQDLYSLTSTTPDMSDQQVVTFPEPGFSSQTFHAGLFRPPCHLA